MLESADLLIIKRVCQFLRKPFFEVSEWPAEELEWWAAFFSIDDNQDQPRVKRPQLSVEDEKALLKEVL